MEIISEQREMEKNYRAIGEWFVSEYEGEVPDAVKDVVAAVIASKERIGELEAAKAAKKEEESCHCSCQEQPAEEIQQKVCPVCGESSDGKFCPKCGAPMGE
jgi:DNA repair exonuclease SbcCD ATPase subunit